MTTPQTETGETVRHAGKSVVFPGQARIAPELLFDTFAPSTAPECAVKSPAGQLEKSRMAVPDGIDTVTRYNTTARAFHAVIAVLVIVNLTIGLLNEALEDTIKLIPLHKSIGFTVLGLTIAWIAWRFTWKTPEYRPALKRFEMLLAKTVHGVFYALLLVIPMTGWIFSSAGKYPLGWFGVPIPKFALTKADPIVGLAKEGHEILGFTMLALVLLHVAAALRHHFMLKDGVLRRMW